ncbi:hypothetical protein [Kitasatospora sp. NPDC058046]
MQLHGRGDGTVDFTKIELDDVDGWAGLRMLAALQPIKDRTAPTA